MARRTRVTAPAPLAQIQGTFYRIVFAMDLPHLLEGAKSPEGRFHHDSQPAFYMSPSPEAAAVAVATYLRDDDPPRVIVRLSVAARRIADLRDPATRTALGLAGHESSVLWMPERAAGLPATSWKASDAARDAGADGMIYASRKEPSRWHLLLFRWNRPQAPMVVAQGEALPFRD